MHQGLAETASAAQPIQAAFYAPWIGETLGTTGGAGGGEVQVLSVARMLARKGHRIAIIGDGATPLPESVEGIALIPEPPWRGRRLGLPGVAFVAWASKSLVFLLSVRAGTLVKRGASAKVGLLALAARAGRRRFVYSSASVVDFDYARLEPSRRAVWLFHLGVRLADAIVVQTEEQVELCRQRFGREPVLIKSFAEPAPLRDARPEAFLWAGRLAPYKRPGAFVELARALPEAKFWMVAVPAGGIGVERLAELRQAAEELPNLELLDPRPRTELLSLINSAVAVVNTSDYEGMPNVFLEAWARGVPALSLHHDPDGVIERDHLGAFAGGSSQQLAEHARHLWRFRDNQTDLAARCRSYIEREHSPQRVTERWANTLCLTKRA
jgi:glycosyltransferase involved in cell wall biosynthesis